MSIAAANAFMGIFGLKRVTEKAPKAKNPPKARRCAVKSCRAEFVPHQPMQKVCSLTCAQESAKQERAKRTAKANRQLRADTRARLEELKGLPELLAEAQQAFNAYIRLRDAGRPCICCGGLPQSGHLTGGEWDAGHYRSVGAAGHLRFHEDNVHRQLKRCNRRAFDASAYRRNLVVKIGLERVEALENNSTPHKWTRDEVRAIRDEYRAKARALKGGKA